MIINNNKLQKKVLCISFKRSDHLILTKMEKRKKTRHFLWQLNLKIMEKELKTGNVSRCAACWKGGWWGGEGNGFVIMYFLRGREDNKKTGVLETVSLIYFNCPFSVTIHRWSLCTDRSPDDWLPLSLSELLLSGYKRYQGQTYTYAHEERERNYQQINTHTQTKLANVG